MNTSQAELVQSLQQEERLSGKTAQTMLQVDRKYFLDPDNLELLQDAYQARAHCPTSLASCQSGFANAA